jgi:hypothetical protein
LFVRAACGSSKDRTDVPRGSGPIWTTLVATWFAGAGGVLAQTAPAARVEVGLWSAPARGAVDATGRLALDLDETIQLDAYWARPLKDPNQGFASGRLQVGRWRLAGGVLGEDAALHLGYGPRFEVALTRSLRLQGELDAALGAGFLRGWAGQRDVGALRYPPVVDLLTAALGGALRLGWKPWRPVSLQVGLHARGVVAAAPPSRAHRVRSGRLAQVARHTELGLTSALSRLAGGSFGQVALRLGRWRGRGGQVELTARYREAWDWYYQDPVYTLLERGDGLAGYTLERVPPRVTRLGGLVLDAQLRGVSLGLGVDVRHVRDSTTARDFADRPGWSVGASLSLSWARVFLLAEGRYQLQDDPRSELLGDSPRVAGSARAGVTLLRGGGSELALVGGVQVGLPDALGITRDDHAWHAGLELQFGGPRRAGPAPPASFPRPSGPRSLRVVQLDSPPASAGDVAEPTGERPQVASRQVDPQVTREQVAGALDLLPPHPLVDDLRGTLDEVELPTVGQVERWIDRHPGAIARIEARFPGLVDGVRALLRNSSRAGGPVGPPALVSGYGREGIRLSLVQRRRASLYAVTSRLEGPASDHAVTERAGLTEELQLTTGSHEDLRGLLAAHRMESFSLIEARRGRARLVFQGDTAWTRGMLYLLTGRSD